MAKLYNGDCLEVMKTFPPHSVDMVLCDLPYGVLDLEWDSIIDGKQLFAEYKRICKQNANVLLFCQIAFAKYLMESTFKHEFSHCLIWEKGNKTRQKSIKTVPLSQYEMILVFRINKFSNKGKHLKLRDYLMCELKKSGMSIDEIEEKIPNRGAHHWFRYTSDFRAPTQHGYKRLQEITGCFPRPWEDVWAEYQSEKNSTCTYNPQFMESDIVRCDLTEKRVHPTQKPVALLEKLLLAYSNEGDTVLDNCMGSGSTGVACRNTGRNFIGIELNKEYFDYAKSRIEASEAQMNLFDYGINRE